MTKDLSDYLAIRRLHAADWKLVRALRLGALQESGQYFGGDFATSAARGEAEWRTWPAGGPVFAGYVDDTPMGIVAAQPSSLVDGYELISLWVTPWARGSGLGAMLIAALADWARARGEAALYLRVMPGNDAARQSYLRCGFVDWRGPVDEQGNLGMRLNLST